ncbi:radical SAM protein, partial [Candidatus Woesearchaeota archaeon CG10_big_fil_rev_8_21_14_0_10_32_9]
MEVKENKWHSWCSGQLAEGCKLCVKGRKLVLFITGMCGQRCFYCPVNEDKFGHDVVYANEWKIKNPDDPKELLEEARLTGAKGAGITGGDPLVKLDRTCQYIRILKNEFGKEFHIHLYTPLLLVSESSLKKLYDAGLDEIRFHLDIYNEKDWNKLVLAKKFNWSVGVEIPVVPGTDEKVKKLIDFIQDKVEFINLNELELSDTTVKHYKLHEMDFKQKDSISYGILGSKDTGVAMVNYAKTKNLPAHFCTAKLKDSTQVGNRLKIRAKNAAKHFDTITSEGLLIRGVAYLNEFVPGANYSKKLENIDESIWKKLKLLRKKIIDQKLL